MSQKLDKVCSLNFRLYDFSVIGGNPRQKTQKKRLRFFGVSLAIYLEVMAAAKEIQTINLIHCSSGEIYISCLENNLFGGMLKMLTAMEHHFFTCEQFHQKKSRLGGANRAVTKKRLSSRQPRDIFM